MITRQRPMSAKKRFLLRVDPRLYDALERWAADELRSVNAHIEYLLKQAARDRGRLRERGDDQQDAPTDA